MNSFPQNKKDCVFKVSLLEETSKGMKYWKTLVYVLSVCWLNLQLFLQTFWQEHNQCIINK